MDGTPKLRRKASLSLTTRLNHNRHSASPKNRMKPSASKNNVNSRDHNASCEALQRSPSVISICSDGGIECTPPHKKVIVNLDDSMDYSPKVLDSSFSPTCMLSQTLAIDSPEVGWKWNRNAAGGRGGVGFEDNTSTRTPDSAYAADSSFASTSSSSTELKTNVRTRSDRLAHDLRREDQRKILEQELRRVEKTRAEEKLKQRCAKLQEQLKCAGTQKSNATISQNTLGTTSSSSGNKRSSSSFPMDVEMRSQTCISATTTTIASTVKMMTPERPKPKKETLNDFFNDSDSDCLLLAATQEIESKFDVKTQPAFISVTNNATRSTNSPTNSISSLSNSIPHANSAPAATTTPNVTPTTSSSKKNETKEKHSSFYMKFLEDDCPDDWFVSLDDVILQATQSKKPRTSLQRYKSMPTETATVASSAFYKDSNKNSNNVPTRLANASEEIASPTSSNLSRMKRHSSTHTLSPASSNYRGRQLQLKK